MWEKFKNKRELKIIRNVATMVVFILAVRNRMAEMLSAFMQKAFSSTVYLSDCPNARRLSSYSPTIFNGRYPFTCVISRCGTRLLLIGIPLNDLIRRDCGCNHSRIFTNDL